MPLVSADMFSCGKSQFQMTVGLSGTSNKTVKLPKNFTLLGPGPGSDSKILKLVGANNTRKDNTSLLQCTHHMCPVRVHWHVKTNYKEYWRVKIAITNFNNRMNSSTWTLVIQHPNLNNVNQVFSFNYQPLVPCASISEYQKDLEETKLCHQRL
ncbi:hypothetical protein Tsubulata_024203 [Turnera subulata]|uniref:COBRA C-terminal domain-containing protein n=1 Tax=Turnera subulata TaxID=218843 RepID=A0A9Q0FVC9_9ROSI|nr:hypothetical protein Tsubulata_024203 [Turnera subulata]